MPLRHFLPGSKGNDCWWMTGKTWEVSTFAVWMHRSWRRSLTSSLQIRKDSSYAQFVPVYAARIKAVEEIEKRRGNGRGDDQE